MTRIPLDGLEDICNHFLLHKLTTGTLDGSQEENKFRRKHSSAAGSLPYVKLMSPLPGSLGVRIIIFVHVDFAPAGCYIDRAVLPRLLRVIVILAPPGASRAGVDVKKKIRNAPHDPLHNQFWPTRQFYCH